MAPEKSYWTDSCRGCTGTCCTGYGSEPCTCEPIEEEEDEDE
jgi:hypothetical protein